MHLYGCWLTLLVYAVVFQKMQDPQTMKLRLQDLGAHIAVTIALLLPLGGWSNLQAYAQSMGYPDAASAGQQSGSPPTLSISQQSPFSGSVPEGKVTPTVLPLSFKDALDRALRNNLGVLLSNDNTLSARGQRWHELSDLLPHVSAGVSETAAQASLAQFGFKLPGLPTIIGPYAFFDVRGYVSEELSYSSYLRTKGARKNEEAAQHSYKDARDLVALATGNAYLQVLAGAARVDTALAQVQTAQALYTKAADQQKAGVTPAIDTLRAQVEHQSRQQQLIVVRNNYAKEKLALARIIGLPPGQEFTLTDIAPFEQLTTLGIEESVSRAYATRSDYQAAIQRVRAAERFRNAATAEHYPSFSFSANYGDLGVTPGHSNGTFEVVGTLNIPIFKGGEIHANVLQTEADLRGMQQQLDNLRGQIDYEVRTALLDLAAAAEQVSVAQSSVDLADQTLTQARDRFAAGVTDNLEVVQAQESVASANENYISSLYAHNLAKVQLARAMGYAEEGVKQYWKSK